MSNTTRIIMIWGVAIVAYLILTHSSGFKTSLGAFNNLITGSTKTLQGR